MPRRTKLTRSGVSLEEAAKLVPALDLELYEYNSCGDDWEDDEPSDAQLGALERFGLEADLDVTKGQAAFVLENLIERAESGLCSLEQAAELVRMGCKNPSEITYKDARAKIRRDQ